MDNELIQTELRDRVLTVRMNRPEKKNALSQAMYSAFAQAMRRADSDPQVRVVLIAAQSDCFSSGNDIVDFLKNPFTDFLSSPVGQMMQALAQCKKPVVAAPCGIAVGVGVTLLLHCDLVYCGADTKFSMPFASLGICPEYASTYILPRMMGHQRAMELVLGGAFDAKKAYEYGLVNALAPNAEAEALARARAVSIAQMPPNAVRTTKMLLKRWREDVVTQAIPLEAGYFGPMLLMPEAQEAMSAFMQKRKPDFAKFV